MDQHSYNVATLVLHGNIAFVHQLSTQAEDEAVMQAPNKEVVPVYCQASQVFVTL